MTITMAINRYRIYCCIAVIFLSLLGASNRGWAIETVPALADTATAPSGYPFNVTTTGKDTKAPSINNDINLVKTLSGLGLVLGLIFVLAKLGKKFHPNLSPTNSSLKIISQQSLGSKEKIALVQVGKQQILIGITAHSINPLLELDEPVNPEATQIQQQKSRLSARTASEFSRKLNEFLIAGQRNK